MALSKSKQAALKVMTERGGTEHERKTAKAMLAKEAKPAKPTQEIIKPRPPKWKGDGIARSDGSNPILSSQIKHFLNSIDENEPFTYKDVHYYDGFGSGHFYAIVNFLESIGLIVKQGSRYTVKSKRAVRDVWNKIMEDAKV